MVVIHPSSLPCQKWTACKMRVVFSNPVHAPRVRGGPPDPNHGHLQPILAATMCMSPCRWPYPPPPVLPFVLIQNPFTGTQRLSFLGSGQCDVAKSALQVFNLKEDCCDVSANSTTEKFTYGMQPTTVSLSRINSHYAESVYNWIDTQII